MWGVGSLDGKKVYEWGEVVDEWGMTDVKAVPSATNASGVDRLTV